MSNESKSASSARSGALGVIGVVAISGIVASVVAGIVSMGVSGGWFPLVSIFAAGVPSTVQVIDSVEVNATEELEVVVFTWGAAEDLSVKVERLSGTGQVAAPGTTNFGDEATVTAKGVTRAGALFLFRIKSSTVSDTDYQLVVTKAGTGNSHDRRTLKVRFRAPTVTPTPAAPTQPGAVTPPTP